MISAPEGAISNEAGTEFIDAVVFSVQNNLLGNPLYVFKTPLAQFMGRQLSLTTLGEKPVISRMYYDEFGPCENRLVTTVHGRYLGQVGGAPHIADISREPRHCRRLLGGTTFWARIVDPASLEPLVAVRIDD